jgi:hypothetical protein
LLAIRKGRAVFYAGNFSSGSPIIEGADENRDGAMTLLLRLVGRGFSPGESPPRILVGRLPEPLPVDLPLPNGARVVGSQLLGSVATMILDVDSPAQRVLDFYRDRLQAAGWTELEQHMGWHGGFTPSARFGPDLTFCHSSRGPSLSVHATDVEGAPADVRLNLNIDTRNSPCAAQLRHGGMFEILPNLTPPAGAQQIPQGGGGGSGSFHSNATLSSNLDLAAVSAHYVQQLRTANWTPQSEGISGPVAWSAWSFKDDTGEDWRGLFFVLRRPEAEGQYVLYLHADSGPDDEASTGWTSYTVKSGRAAL